MLRTNIHVLNLLAWVVFIGSVIAAIFTLVNPDWLSFWPVVASWPSISVAVGFIFFGTLLTIKLLGLAEFLLLLIAMHDDQKKIKEIFAKQ